MNKKRTFTGILLTTVLLLAGIFSLNAAAANDAKQVDIIFTHDTHSHLNEFVTVENGQSQTLGGYAKLKTLIDRQKEKNPDTLLLDGGDFSMGTLVQVIFEDEAPELRLLGDLGMDAVSLGNHEFDYKATGLANMLNTAVASGDSLPPIVLCNVDWEGMKSKGLTEEQQLLLSAFENYGVAEYIMVEKNGVKIAITGVIGIDSEACIANCPLEFINPSDAVKETVSKIKATENPDMIVCVSHSGVMDIEDKSEDEILAKAVPELDFIVSGHTHTLLKEPIVHGNTYIGSVGEYGKYLGSATLTQKEDGRWSLDKYELITIDTSIEADETMQKKIDEFSSVIDSKYLSQFGYTADQVLCTNEVEFVNAASTALLHTEANLGSIMMDAYTYTVENFSDSDPHPVDMTVVPSGVIRDTYALGNITVENVFNSFSLGIGSDGIPGYPLISVYLTGEELKTAAEIDASISPLMPSARLYTDGLYWHYNPNRMILNKVTDVYLCNGNEERVELEDDTLYRVVTDFYTSQMLGGVTDMSFGLLSIVPKHADGTPVTNYEDTIITVDGKELKAWTAIAAYMASFEDTDNDGLGNVPAKYATMEGRKVVEDSKNIFDLIKKPNKFGIAITAIILLLVLLVVVIVRLVIKVVKKILKKKA